MIKIKRTATVMDAPTGDAQKLPDMVMCGDHPSFTKTELNVKEAGVDDKGKDKLNEKSMLSCAKITPKQSRTETVGDRRTVSHVERALAASEHALRVLEARRRAARDPPHDLSAAVTLANSRPIVQAFPFAAMGSFRWPPYLLAVWVLVLVLTHVLHCLVNMLEKALPALKKCTSYFRTWTETTWTNDQELNHKLCPIGLAAITGVLYTMYFGLYAVYAVVVWAVEPLGSDVEESRNVDVESKVTDYVDIINSKTNCSIKQ